MHRFGMTLTFLISWLMVLLGSVTPQNNIMYVVTSATWPDPNAKVILRTESHSEAEKMYEELSNAIKRKKGGSVVLYNVAKGEVEQLTKFRNPVYNVNCVETARKQKSTDGTFKDETKENDKMYYRGVAISTALGQLSSVPGAGSSINMHIMAVYYAATFQGAKVAGVVFGWFCAFNTTLIGFAYKRTKLGMICSMVSGYLAAKAMEWFILLIQACPYCDGSGFVGDYERCPNCNGFGYTGHNQY